MRHSHTCLRWWSAEQLKSQTTFHSGAYGVHTRSGYLQPSLQGMPNFRAGRGHILGMIS